MGRSVRPLVCWVLWVGLGIGPGCPAPTRYASIDDLCKADPRVCESTPDPEPPVGNRLAVHVLNVGHGNCILVECPHSKDSLLIDCGAGPLKAYRPRRSPMSRVATAGYIGKILQARGGVTTVILTHAHLDHVNRVAAALGKRTIARILVGGERKAYDNGLFRSLGAWLKKQQDTGVPVEAREQRDRPGARQIQEVADLKCGGVKLFRLTADAVGFDRSGVLAYRNATSYVSLLRYKSFTAIFPGDATGSFKHPTTDRALDGLRRIRPSVRLPISLVVSPHHGSATHGSNNEAWTKGTKPVVTVFSSATSLGHPNCAAVYRYHRHAIRRNLRGLPDVTCTKGGTIVSPNYRIGMNRAVYTTQDYGTVRVVTDGSRMRVGCDFGSKGLPRYCGVNVALGYVRTR